MSETVEKRNALKPEEYWEWRTTITELHLAQEQDKSFILEHKYLQKEAEMKAMQAQLFMRSRLQPTRDRLEGAKKEYERFKKVLEDRLGFSFDGKVIDEVTYELKDLPQQPIPNKGEEK